ncbi:C2H2 type zinc-finger-domain-containing protein [Hypoxylon sp. FL1284]|nr:C2H2 type zinc-finger-domain-containing protein [Hypoxylon sp. FL1284]
MNTPLSVIPLNVSPSSYTPTSLQKSIDYPNMDLQSFLPGQCLFCPNPSSSFTNNVIHMQKSHGLFVPHRHHLVVDLETLFRYLHLIIFGYRECIECGTEKATIQAVQQHMTGKGHCKFDISKPGSEFTEFYDFSELGYDVESDVDDGFDDEKNRERAAARRSNQKPLLADEDSIRLPSGKIIVKQSSAHAASSSAHLRRRTRNLPSRLEYFPVEPVNDLGSSKDKVDLDVHETSLLSRREKRERATVAYQFANMSTNDRNSLVHLSAAQQRSLLVTQHRDAERSRKEEGRRRSKIDRKGNKNLYAYWATETPVYQCG